MIQVTATEFKTNFGKYLSLAEKEDIRITKNGKSVFKLSAENDKSWLDELVGIIPGVVDEDLKKLETERLWKKYESLN
jgi:prevent-host-death family protein